jgi:APA family basic amino acid/polyamine antiporter
VPTIKTSTSYKVGLNGAIGIVLGTVIGSGIFIMIGPLAVETGPGLFLCYLFALVIAITSSICYAQVASVFPATAATYRYARMFYGNFVGFIIGWMRLVCSLFGLALMSGGFAQYVSEYSSIDSRLIAAAILTVFMIVNLLGIKTTQLVQQILVVAVITGLSTFCFTGMFGISIVNLSPVMGAGAGPILKGSLTAFYAYTGLYVIAEMGEEVQNPQRNIPLSIFIASIIVGFLYLFTALVFSGGLGWDLIKELQPNLVQASALMLPRWATTIVRLSAITAIMAPMNACFMISIRSFYGLACDRLMPSAFARVNRYNVPALATVVIYVLSLIIVLLDLPLLFLGTISSIMILIGMSLVAGACLKIKFMYPKEFESAPFKLSDGAMKILSVFTVVSAVILIAISLIEDPMILYSFAFWLLTGCGYYYARKKK